MRATIEPLRDFKIDITATRTFTENRTGYIKANAEGEYGSFSEQNTGNFSITFFAIGSAFVKDNKNYSNQNFEDLKDYRYEISQRLAAQNGNSSGINPENGYQMAMDQVRKMYLYQHFWQHIRDKIPQKYI